MKYLLHLALISVLLSGCADTPMKEASIEDRELIATTGTTSTKSDAKPDTVAVISDKSFSTTSSATTSGTQDPNITTKTLAADSNKATTGVVTQGVNMQNPEAKPLSASNTQPAGAVAQNSAASQADRADILKYEAQPVLDPKDPKSPLAQRRLLFDYDSSAIRDEYRTLLEMHAKFLIKENSARLILQGHADERGSREYNLALGQRRAESVFNALNLLGVPDAQMEAVSLGEEKPVVEGHDESAWAQNRRTEILYQGE
jgi:peptidoglycan-associated lipoprotein